jgi:hypothetical protein
MSFARKFMVATVAASMVAAPVAVSAADTGARVGTTDVVRVGSTQAAEASELKGAGLLAILSAVGLIAGIALAAGGGGSNPTSP